MKYPFLSIIIPTLNNEKDLPLLFSSLSKQVYPKDKLEIIVSDGGSKDSTRNIAKKNNALVIHNTKILAEPGVQLGMKKAKGELLMILAVDNIFEEEDSLTKIASCFSDSHVYAAFPRHESNNRDTLFTKYINTFTDPASHFLYGYASNGRTFSKIYKTIKHTKIYDVYDFSSSSLLPLLALAQGFTVRADFIKRERNGLDDISPVLDLIKEKKEIAYVYSVPLFHHTIGSIGHFIRKQRWATKNALEKRSYGLASRTQTLTSWQKLKIYIYPFYSLSIIFPIIRGIWHAYIDVEPMWLVHPYVAFVSGLAIWYEYVTIILLKKNKKLSRQ